MAQTQLEDRLRGTGAVIFFMGRCTPLDLLLSPSHCREQIING
jgi:hypothetical protein